MDSPEDETEAKEGAAIEEEEESWADHHTTPASDACSMFLYLFFL